MALLLKNNAVFLHVPKTAGTWISQVLRELGLVHQAVGREHTTYERLFWYDRFYHDDKVVRNIARRAIGRLPKISPDCYKFCFVREPLDWYVSWWRYMQGNNWRRWGNEENPYQWSPVSALNDLGSPDFNTFVHNVNRKRPGFVTELYGSYVRPGISFVGKQESLIDDLVKVLKQIKVNVDADRLRKILPINESKSDIPVPEWDPALRRETLRLEYTGYVRYGYPVEKSQA